MNKNPYGLVFMIEKAGGVRIARRPDFRIEGGCYLLTDLGTSLEVREGDGGRAVFNDQGYEIRGSDGTLVSFENRGDGFVATCDSPYGWAISGLCPEPWPL
jgi:hypothetical protein